MKKLLIFLAMGAIWVSVFIFSGSTVRSAIPHLINYQGMLTQSDGITPVDDGIYSIRFSIWDDATLGTEQWNETQNVQVTNGLFNVTLGSVTPLFLQFEKYYWLEVKVGSDDPLPRIKLTSVGYAYWARNADTAQVALTAESYPHNHDDRYVNINGPDSIRTTGSGSKALYVKTYGGGDADGILIYTQGSYADGIYIDSAGDAGIEMYDIGDAGIWMDDIHDDGIHMSDVAGDGIYLGDIEQHGIYINDAADNGLYVKLADNGVYIDSTRAGKDGVVIRYAEDDGVQVNHADDDGIYISDAGSDGINVWHADGRGVYIYDSDRDGIYVASADSDGIEAKGATGGGELWSLSELYYGLRVHSYNSQPDNLGLYVFGSGGITGTWSTKLPGSSGDVPGFMVCSPDVELILSGTGTLVNGQAQITFEPEFQEAISPDVPVKVVLTAQGAPSGLLYVASKSNQGFSVKRLEIPDLALKSVDDITFDWIAIGRQKGYEQRPQILAEEGEMTAGQSAFRDEMGPEELRHQEELKQDELYRQKMLKRQAQREAERIREREREEESTD